VRPFVVAQKATRPAEIDVTNGKHRNAARSRAAFLLRHAETGSGNCRSGDYTQNPHRGRVVNVIGICRQLPGRGLPRGRKLWSTTFSILLVLSEGDLLSGGYGHVIYKGAIPAVEIVDQKSGASQGLPVFEFHRSGVK
jgi:hypothetical protein